MKIVIDNVEFDYNLGCKILKLKYKEPFSGLEDIWEDIVILAFKEICEIENIEQRRIAINAYGIERLHKELNAKLVDKKVIKKKTTWILEDGTPETKKYNDEYKLYQIDGDMFTNPNDPQWQKFNDQQYVVCKDTSTDREYLIWIDNDSVYHTNIKKELNNYEQIKPINAIQAIAWTITTNIPQGKIETIVRQGDCILIKPKGKYEELFKFRHLTEKEYLKLLTKES